MRRDKAVRPGGAAVGAQRLLSFPLGTREPRLWLGLWTKLGDSLGPRERTSQTPIWRSFPRRGRGWRRQGSGEAAGPGSLVLGLKGRRRERKGQLRTWKTAPPPTGLVFTPRHLGPGAQMSRDTKGREKKALKKKKKRGGGDRKDEPLNS